MLPRRVLFVAGSPYDVAQLLDAAASAQAVACSTRLGANWCPTPIHNSVWSVSFGRALAPISAAVPMVKKNCVVQVRPPRQGRALKTGWVTRRARGSGRRVRIRGSSSSVTLSPRRQPSRVARSFGADAASAVPDRSRSSHHASERYRSYASSALSSGDISADRGWIYR